MSKCNECGGTGKVTLFTSEKDCEACGGLGVPPFTWKGCMMYIPAGYEIVQVPSISDATSAPDDLA